ncbi:TCR/Tet family MFS transporter [Pontivivens insulae]|uniref:Tetracycline resistance protein, class C n=1 Tax=Pontivivens insulae TaxID=1639689 RepID=A0A2R8AEJ2_9RHOB|nr:TCR/Tet family MFS transporter [Pontivivens insulae]RED11849.1 DHA1 family tetracycline resistance protein-like MFS transporter [Pontivivens insulae]SPF30606.1 Tetracycline resistance protein, class C [Pontivivens insulae]
MSSRLPFIFVFVTIVIDAMGIGIILPVMPDLIRSLQGGSISQAAVWGGALAFTYAAMQFLFSPTLGNLSDRFGRRRVLLISLIAMGVDYILMGFAGALWLLFIARTISGIAGATFSVAYAFIADISPKEQRAANFGLIGAGFGIGFVAGPMLGGLIGQLGPQAPFFAAGILALLNAAFGYFVMPETLAESKRRPFRWREGNPFAAILAVQRLPGIGLLIFALLFYQIGSNVYPVIWAYFTQEQFGMTLWLVSVSLTVFGLSTALVQGVLIRVFLSRLSAATLAAAGLAMNIVVYLLIIWVPNTPILFMLLPLSALGVVVMPALQGIMSNEVEENQQGELQGVISSMNALAAITAQLLMTWLFRVFTAQDAPVYLPAAPFAMSALLTLIALGMFLQHAKRAGLSIRNKKRDT